MFDIDDKNHPKIWKEMSFDFKLFFVFHSCLMVLMIVGRGFPILILIGIVSSLLVSLAGISVYHRLRSDWHWPGIGVKNIVGVLFSIALGLFFVAAATPRISPLNPAFFPWFVAVGGIILFWILSGLNIVFRSEVEFQSHCGDQRYKIPDLPSRSFEPSWKKAARGAFTIYFMAVWIAGVSFFWKFNVAFRDGTPKPTDERTETLRDHGKTVYITPEEKRIVSLLEYALMLGIPSAIALGALIHFVLGVKLFPNAPTIAERKQRANQGNN